MKFSFDFLAKVVVTAALACSGLVALADPSIPYLFANSSAFISSSHGFIYVNNDKSYLSTDFSHWQDGGIPQGQVAFNRIATNGKLFVKIDDKKAYSSVDGVTWTLLDPKLGEFESVFMANGHFILVSWIENKILMSDDAKTWSSSEVPDCLIDKTECHFSQIIFFRGHYFAYVRMISDPNQSRDNIVIMRSKDGLEWKNNIQPFHGDQFYFLSSLYNISAGNEVILAMYNHDVQSTLVRSVDGINWTADNSVAMSNVSYVDGNFYANSVDELVSSDGYNWQTAVWLNGEKVPGGFVTKHKDSLYYIGKPRNAGTETFAFVTGRSVDSIHWGQVKQN